MDIITRKQAKEQGLKQYYTGKACVRGHMGYTRKTSDGKCMECAREDDRVKYYNGGKEKKLAYHRSDKYKAYQKEWRKKNYHEKLKHQPKSEARIAYLKKYYEEHKGEKAARTRKRRGQLKQASIFAHEKNVINEFYKNCPKGYHVDHIIPLSHPDVCGLHCLANLQYLTAEENLAKGNSFSDE